MIQLNKHMHVPRDMLYIYDMTAIDRTYRIINLQRNLDFAVQSVEFQVRGHF